MQALFFLHKSRPSSRRYPKNCISVQEPHPQNCNAAIGGSPDSDHVVGSQMQKQARKNSMVKLRNPLPRHHQPSQPST
ncbi:hypothetical protein VIGAN_07175100 [Vigna angularis var. angularis]|uniref:Uncharacterized protein n=1 Tax=Vigna angularis var. angularis TaxID=157739 RepID=A0A0S3SJ47_PHAAN|nr:hypothetical protein VIGAN_07175100 [Vigna angularis var. angularis]